MINIHLHLFIKLGGTSIFRTIQGKANWSELPGGLKKSRVNIQCLTGDGKLSFVRIIGNQGVQERGGGVCTEATSYKSIGLILTFHQLIIKKISLEKVIQVCFLLFYCNTEPLQGFIDDFPKFRRSLLMKGQQRNLAESVIRAFAVFIKCIAF